MLQFMTIPLCRDDTMTQAPVTDDRYAPGIGSLPLSPNYLRFNGAFRPKNPGSLVRIIATYPNIYGRSSGILLTEEIISKGLVVFNFE